MCVWVVCGSLIPSRIQRKIGFYAGKGGWYPVQGFRSLSWLAYELLSTRVSHGVEP